MSGRHRRARRPASMRGLFRAPAFRAGAATGSSVPGRVPLRSATGRIAAVAVLGTTAVTAGAALTIAATLGGPGAGPDSTALTVGSRNVAAGSAATALGAPRRPEATGTATVRVAAKRHSGHTAASRPSGTGQAGTTRTPDHGKPVIGPGARRTGRSVPTVRAGRNAHASASASASASGGTVVSASGTGHVEIRAKRKPRRATADDVIKLARTQLGVREDSWGVTKYSVWYAGTPRAAETARRDGGRVDAYRTAPWCDMFVSWLGSRTGTTASVGSDAYTVEHARWFQQRRRWGGTPKAGALVFFDWNGKYSRDIRTIDHVGLVVKDNRNGTIQTIEGNTSDAVVLKNRPVTSIVGYGYPDFVR